ncbi:orotate phosphoribosyltransferase [Pseudomarimonas arenosa]|uniref:Orotate phosphoribosyltransferase n=1 Tax=Pseudomarimonas arenosa TaxID=2774145 RepID=A0AAW3ZS09_9GAMM|nr:orotate phosphoribosyltransferase [Pseudomarimonas arenosa]MBD8527021.1 orotate phosphoribosyltransferase [Pseudomarimonas arenosa]
MNETINSSYQQTFLRLAEQCQALRFGEFTLKSGRQSPYFFNAGQFTSGASLAALAACYVDALEDSGLHYDMLFGPAYKGIPLATAVAVELARRGSDVALCFNRKEPKHHGEGGQLIGAPLKGKVLIVDDVITAGTAVREAVGLIRNAGAEVCGLLIALDRQERGTTERSAAQELSLEQGIPVIAVARLQDLLAYTEQQPQLAGIRPALLAYRAQFGVAQ